MSQINPYALGIAILTILGIVIMNKIDRRIPAALIMILIATSLDYLFNLPLTTIGSRFGAIRFQLPTFRFPFLDLGNISGLILPAISIALLGGIGKSPGSLPLEGVRRHASGIFGKVNSASYWNVGVRSKTFLPI